MARHARNDATMPEFDAFLDIVANLIGILVILIMIIGVRTKNAWDETASESSLPDQRPLVLPDVVVPKAEVARLGGEVDDMARRLEVAQRGIQEQDQQQQQLRFMVSAKSQQMAAWRALVEKSQGRSDELVRQLTAARFELDQLYQEQSKAEQRADEPTVIKHYPTPLAKTVFGREEHFRLLSGRLVHVPLNQLSEQLRSEARLKAWKLKNATTVTEVLGPVEGFRIKYTLRRRNYAVRTPSGPARQTVVELDRFVLVPVADDLGEPLETALQPGSSFRRRLQQLDPENTTITVWTYEDSFLEFRRIKTFLQEQGFLSAARPLPHGHPIGGSPRGSKSAAQ